MTAVFLLLHILLPLCLKLHPLILPLCSTSLLGMASKPHNIFSIRQFPQQLFGVVAVEFHTVEDDGPAHVVMHFPVVCSKSEHMHMINSEMTQTEAANRLQRMECPECTVLKFTPNRDLPAGFPNLAR